MVKELSPWGQIDRLAHMSPQDIPSGVLIPETILMRFVKPNAWVLNYGSGYNSKHLDIAPVGLDINEEAVAAATIVNPFSLTYKSDVTQFEIPKLNIASLGIIENIDVVFMEALLCNITGREVNGKTDWNDWQRAITSAHIALAPNGYLIIGDMLRADQDNPILERQFDPQELLLWKKQWKTRYEYNHQLGMPYGMFYVAKPGPMKDTYDFGTPETFQEMMESGNLERSARHFSLSQIMHCACRLGFHVAYQEYSVFYSRNNLPLSGFFLVLQKQDRYQYHHRYHDLTEKEVAKGKDQRKHLSLKRELEGLYQRLPEPDYYFPSLEWWIAQAS